MPQDRAETFDEVGMADAVASEIWNFTDRLGQALRSAVFQAAEDQDPAELLATTIEEATASLKEHAEEWAKRKPLKKREPVEKTAQSIAKFDDDEQLVFGYFNVAVNKSGETVVDLQGDIITPEVLEHAAYDYVLESRAGGDMHDGDAVATLVESMVFTPEKLEKMGLSPDAVPARWWGGFKIHDREVFDLVKSGERPMFSIEGEAERVEV